MRRSLFRSLRHALAAVLLLACCAPSRTFAIIHLDTGDPSLYTSTPGDNSGWQFEGIFGGYLGTPIAPLYFISAKHVGMSSGTFIFHGESFTIVAGFGDPDTDLQIWQVDHAFTTYAPLYTATDAEMGQEVRIFGRGTQRGAEIDLGGTERGWQWGPADGVERWGRNIVADIVPNDPGSDWIFLQASFDSPGLPGESHLSTGDSGGGDFVFQDGLWRLAGINYGVDVLFTSPDASTLFAAAIFDARGYYFQNDDGSFSLVTGDANVPTSFYSTQISSRLNWIQGVIGQPVTTLPTEDFTDWSHAYFTPDQLADASVSGPYADPDGDGVPNLLEFAFNLDPTFPEPVLMTAGTGVRGLPLIQLAQVAAGDQRLTVEFVRRTATSGAGITYATQFTSSLDAGPAGWQTGGTEAVTAINARWERVKVTDSISLVAGGSARFARVLVTTDNAGAPAARKRQAAK